MIWFFGLKTIQIGSKLAEESSEGTQESKIEALNYISYLFSLKIKYLSE